MRGALVTWWSRPPSARYRERVLRRLVLWDIDGTLLHAGELGAAVFDLAVEEVLGRRPSRRPRMSGKTDPQIVGEYLAYLDVECTADTVRAVLDVLEARLSASSAELAGGGCACEGAEVVLEHLSSDPRVLCSVLTGNIAPNAETKLAAFGLDRLLDLEVGAYGSDDADRTRLVPVAMRRAAALRGASFAAGDVWVVGDTPRDLVCARAAGARCLLVGTGRYSPEALARSGADAVLDDLGDTGAVLKVLTGDL